MHGHFLCSDQAIARSTGEKNEGLSWGRSAVEMGLARMSALGTSYDHIFRILLKKGLRN
jgi:hypothetical protein